MLYDKRNNEVIYRRSCEERERLCRRREIIVYLWVDENETLERIDVIEGRRDYCRVKFLSR